MARIVVSGYLLRLPFAGNVLASWQYVVGLHRLGHHVSYVEESGWPGSSYDPRTGYWSDMPHAGLAVARELARRHDVDVPICFVDRDAGTTEGASWGAVRSMLDDADLLLDVGGVCWLDDFDRCERRALVDMDPFFTQVGGFASKVLDRYDVHFTYGTNVGARDCAVPTRDVAWIPTLPPVVIDLWASPDEPTRGSYTTVANWTGYGGLEHEGRWYGQKDSEFLKVVDLPRRSRTSLELALAGAPDDVHEQFRAGGWTTFDAVDISVESRRYVDFVTSSRGEFSAAKHAYVATRSGWVSDRSASYLAAGRPVVVQDTGVVGVPAGDGFVTFATAEEAVDRLRTVDADWRRHSDAARELVSQLFAHDRVLPRLVDTALAAQPSGARWSAQ